MRDEKEDGQIVITGMTVLKVVSFLSGILGIVFLATNLMGLTEMDWIAVGSSFVAPFLYFVVKAQ
ncbi:MAG: hypothetical protein FWB91_02480 [Defluviitaleaceae bacterium]|nr:hypothetical protein [Defluviitaleaceae bacterium]